MPGRDKDGTIIQPDYRVRVRVPLHKAGHHFEAVSKKDGTVDINVDGFNRVLLTINMQEEDACDKLIVALEEAKKIMKAKRKKGRKV